MADRIDLQFSKYQRSGMNSRYKRDEGLLVIPVMGPAGTPSCLVRVHAPVGVRSTDFEYVKQGTPPLIPAMQDTTSGDIFLGAVVEFKAPVMDDQKILMYAARGEYEFVQAAGGRGQGDTFPIDSHPFLTSVDALGELMPNMTSPQDLTTDGLWYEDSVDTNLLTTSKTIG